MTPEMMPVASSSIASIGYDPERRELRVCFRRTREMYVYRDVDARIFQEFLQAESKGDYFNQTLKGKYGYSPVARETP